MKLAPLLILAGLAACSPREDAQAQPSAQAATAAPPALARPAGAPSLVFPVDCVVGASCEIQNYADLDPGPGVKDFRCGPRTYDGHSGTDIRLPDMAAQAQGVRVLAAAPGRVARLRDGVADISVTAPGAPDLAGQDCGNGVVIDHGGGWETQYCHLARGSVVVKVGDQVTAGQPIARIGLSGRTEYPHLHLTVRQGTAAVEAMAPETAAGACAATASGPGLWAPSAAPSLGYKRGVVLNAGFAAAPVTMPGIEAGAIARPQRTTPLVAYARAIGLEGGDIQRLTLVGADGATLATSQLPPLDRAKAQYMMFVGKPAPPAGWSAGRYRARYEVERAGAVVLKRDFDFAF